MEIVDVAGYAEYSFDDMIRLVNSRSLLAVIQDEACCNAVFQKPTEASDSYHHFLTLVVDHFHDSFSMDSVQRKTVTNIIKNKSMTLRKLYQMLMDGRALLPHVTSHSATGLSGAYPTGSSRGRSPSVRDWGGEAPAQEEEPTAARRASSAPPRPSG